ncbi:hypothetical protein C2E23DRAFT_395050 [Lenzites betulinus]|nr:hypothetical protein C2E23DRAFT_395050 [Lenzites betulinus]
MRLSFVLYIVALVDTAFAAALIKTPSSVRAARRGLDGFGILDGPPSDQTTTPHDHTLAATGAAATSTPISPDDSGLKSFLGFSSSAASTSSKNKAKETAAVPTGTSYSVIGSLPAIQTPTVSHSAIPSATTPPPTPPTVAAAASHDTSPGSGTSEWKIIGVAVIAFTTVAGILLLSVFFDQWWHFVHDLICRRRKDSEEELVPDWEKAEWHLRFAQDRQRYPSFSSLPSVAMVQPPPPAVPGPYRNPDSGRNLGQQPGSVADLAGYPQETLHDKNLGGIGLGLGRTSSTRREGSPSSGGTAGRSPSLKRGNNADRERMINPFDDIHSPMPEDVYGGVAG